MNKSKPLVAIIMGSNSDWPIMEKGAKILEDFDITYEKKVVSAHRTPDLMFEFAENAKKMVIKL
jgi:5-(carboxyamino)imidazole ribonucleotide mutase